MITLYTKKSCPYADRIKIILEEKRVSFKVIELVNSNKLNHGVHLPYVQERDKIISDVEVIVLYLEERYPMPALLPSDTSLRAHVRMLMLYIEEQCYPILNSIITINSIKEIELMKTKLVKNLKNISFCFSKYKFCVYDNVTLADCSLIVLLYYFLLYDLEFNKDLNNNIMCYVRRMLFHSSTQKVLSSENDRKIIKIFDSL